MGILITPSVYVYADISPILNETEDDPLPEEYLFPLYAKLTVELGLGGDGLFTVPFYIALTSVPLNEDFTFSFDDVSDESNPPASDELLRLLFGIGVDIKF
jgi:hypothetical protein